MYNYKLLDMIEVGIENYKGVSEFQGVKAHVGHKPMMLFQGNEFDFSIDHINFKNLMIDFFRGEVMEKISAEGLDNLLVFTSIENKILFRSYGIEFL